ncbi:hypothetical protein [Paraburkholderia phosphatilytica]|nr:hypothetical protein [Paraburkholderia phosphatilytica]
MNFDSLQRRYDAMSDERDEVLTDEQREEARLLAEDAEQDAAELADWY